ncbi:tyrosine-type recombinase/integrase [Aneurinibacillus aneurinilyticus]|uniref:tyrosine-type recombinase/integrase n=1 Tax=Aneurinibacillus aneurinilyticus TaxID=1391 RepID=UPI0035240A46
MLLKFALKDFQDDREFKNLSEITINAYMLTLHEFQSFCSERGIIDISEVTPAIIKSYLVHCQKDRKNNPTTRNSKLHHLKIFFNYLEKNDIITDKGNPTKKIEYAKQEVKIEVFNDNHIKQMLGYYRRIKYRDKSLFAYRDYSMILVLLGTGIRLGELCNLKWKEVDLVNGTIIVFGKKRQQSSVPITDKLIKELAEYKVFCERQFEELTEYVFINRNGEQLTPNAVKCIFKRLKEIMNFKDVRLSAHTFRHTFAHRMLANGCDVFTLQKMLRHSNLRMTERYLAIWGTALRDQNNKFNPLNNLDV